MGHLEITSFIDVRHSKFKGQWTWRKKSGGCRDSTFQHMVVKVRRKVMFYLIIFVITKRGTWRNMASLVPCSERFECFSSFIKYIFRHILASFCCFSLQIFRQYCLWVIINPRLILLRVLKNPFSTNLFFFAEMKVQPCSLRLLHCTHHDCEYRTEAARKS